MNSMVMNQMGMNPMVMNQMGMNPINMNPMNMNQLGMNPLGINNQFNSMNIMNADNVTMNVKNLIQPYENKIKELEEKIRQKDFEITVLKQKLNISYLNNNFINMNQMMVNQNMNQMMAMENKEIDIIIKSEKEEHSIKCFENDKMSKVKEKYNIKGILTHNFRVLEEGKSIKENGIKPFYIIEVKPNFVNMFFKKTNGDIHTLSFSDDLPIGLAILLYITKFENPIYLLPILNNKGSLDDIVFTFNATKLFRKDITPLRTIFRNSIGDPIITVIPTKNITNRSSMNSLF